MRTPAAPPSPWMSTPTRTAQATPRALAGFTQAILDATDRASELASRMRETAVAFASAQHAACGADSADVDTH